MKTLFIISCIILGIQCLYFGWIVLCDIIGLFCKKKRYPDAEPLPFAVIVCARNEEKVIGNLLDSLNRQDYPADKMKVFVVAHNCTDNTAKIASDYGAEVLIRNNPRESHKGEALRFGVKEIRKRYKDYFKVI